MNRRRAERGLSTAVEAALLIPGVLLLVALIVVGGRLALARQAVGAATAQGAREASISRTANEAMTHARTAVLTGLAERNIRCTEQAAEVDASGLARPLGTTAFVEVRVRCTVSLADVTIPGLPGTITLTATHRSPVDTYRGR